MIVTIHPTADAVAVAAADLVADFVSMAEHAVTLGLAGGATPRAAYRRLRGHDIGWGGVTTWLSDERWVPPDHQESNARMVREAFLDHVDAGFVAPDTTHGDPAQAAADYQQMLLPQLSENGSVRPDLVLLGIGPDGHTASLFPGSDALDAAEPGYVATWVEAHHCWRLTATGPLLQRADHVVFLATGERKADIVHRVVDRAERLPAWTVAAGANQVTWLLDKAAASRLG